MTATRTARERARAELTQEIKDEARRQLADGRRARAVAARGGPGAGHGVLRALPVLPQPRPAADRPDRRRLQRDRRGGRAGRPGHRRARPRAVAGDLARRRATGPAPPARVRADLRLADPRLPGAAGHRRARRPGSRSPWSTCSRTPSCASIDGEVAARAARPGRDAHEGPRDRSPGPKPWPG